MPTSVRDFGLAGVPKTLLMPLLGRANATRSGSPILSDPKAVEIVQELNVDFERLGRAMPASNDFVSIGRARVLDDVIHEFLSQNPKATIVNLGAGLDTTFWRVDNGLLTWFDVDFPEVIDIRRRFLTETDRNRCIASSFLEADWVQKIGPRSQGILFFSGGVFVYLQEAELQRLFSILVGSFPGADLVFDVQSKLSVFIGNLILRRAGMGSARLRWGARDSKPILKLHSELELIEEFPAFSKLGDEVFPDQDTLRRARIMDRTGALIVVHLRLAAKGRSLGTG